VTRKFHFIVNGAAGICRTAEMILPVQYLLPGASSSINHQPSTNPRAQLLGTYGSALRERAEEWRRTQGV
jgi:hypothetical protein